MVACWGHAVRPAVEVLLVIVTFAAPSTAHTASVVTCCVSRWSCPVLWPVLLLQQCLPQAEAGCRGDFGWEHVLEAVLRLSLSAVSSHPVLAQSCPPLCLCSSSDRTGVARTEGRIMLPTSPVLAVSGRLGRLLSRHLPGARLSHHLVGTVQDLGPFFSLWL